MTTMKDITTTNIINNINVINVYENKRAGINYISTKSRINYLLCLTTALGQMYLSRLFLFFDFITKVSST